MQLHQRLLEIQQNAGFSALGVAVHDYATGHDFGLEADRWFHAASTIKVALLLAVFRAVDAGALRLEDPVHIRNRFRSAVEGTIFRVESDRDADAACHQRIGRTMTVGELARLMITRSSNLATNLLLDLVGLENARATIAAAGLENGVRLRRSVEDHAAFAAEVNNEVTARGLVDLFGLIRGGDFVSAAAQRRMIEILLHQEFNSMIPARLPNWATAAHKTGEISTHCHDAGLIFLPNREPYAVAILTEGPAGLEERQRAVARISETIFQEVTA